MTADTTHFAAEALDRLAPLDRHERAMLVLTGEVGPLFSCPLSPPRAMAAYVVYLAWIRARVPGEFLSGRPGYEAWKTMQFRVATAARRAGSLREFGPELFRRLKLQIVGLSAHDALWWATVRDRVDLTGWRDLSQDEALTDVVQGAKMLDELLREISTT